MYEIFGEKVNFYKIFRQQNRDLANKLGVKSSPTLLFFQDGKEVSERLNGGIRKSEILDRISKLIDSNDFNSALSKTEKKIKHADVLVLGGGPAGLSAAIYSAQAKLKTIILEQELPGGQVKLTHMISNYPGTGKAVPGYELSHKMEQQAKDSGAEIISAIDLTNIKFSKDGDLHSITIDRDTIIYAKSVILTMGARPRLLNIAGEREYKGQGVSYCAICDGKYFDEKEIVVIGGGSSAVEESLFLTRFASRLTIIHQLDSLSANKTAQEHITNNNKIDIIYNSEPRRF
ncbi:MAG: FAD-dependent oxidoreductase, partial [Leptospiraceae bacterium]|nr:FAD-dependent oxidoreductase [Leptospiraceae bacterium]